MYGSAQQNMRRNGGFMSFGKNLQFLRHLRGNMTQEDLAEKMNISRQTVSKWELDTAQPEMDKAIELCKLFNCSLDNLFRDEMVTCGESYTNLRVETVPGFRYIKHAVISADPEGDAIDRIFSIARSCRVDHPPCHWLGFSKCIAGTDQCFQYARLRSGMGTA